VRVCDQLIIDVVNLSCGVHVGVILRRLQLGPTACLYIIDEHLHSCVRTWLSISHVSSLPANHRPQTRVCLVTFETTKTAIDRGSRSDRSRWLLTVNHNLDFQSQASYGHDPLDTQLKFRSQSVYKIKWKHTDERTYRRTDGCYLLHYLPFRSVIMLMIIFIHHRMVAQ